MDDELPFGIQVTRDGGPLNPDESQLRDAIIRTLRRHDCPRATISVALVDDARIAKLNKQYLRHDGATDVLSFNLSEEPFDLLEGEVVISTQTAEREALDRGHDPMAEVLLYAIHGTLHLLGLKDDTAEQADRMHRIEEEVLMSMGVGRVYGAGVS
ncbi:MAG: rRNA maturation RNase YbeY [Planctomycetes bacterium]|nr:rRNA maturation RNase YbeY [Planctomycetota bacterium]